MAKRKLEHDSRADAPARCMLFNEDGGKIFVGEEAIEAALEAGFEDAPLPADQLAQATGDEAADLRALNKDLNEALVDQHNELKAASAKIAELEGQVSKETARANAAESKLAAALKKAKENARK